MLIGWSKIILINLTNFYVFVNYQNLALSVLRNPGELSKNKIIHKESLVIVDFGLEEKCNQPFLKLTLDKQ